MTWRVNPLNDSRCIAHWKCERGACKAVKQTPNDIVEDRRASRRPIDLCVRRRKKPRIVAEEIEGSEYEASAEPIARVAGDDGSDDWEGHDRPLRTRR